MTSWGLFQPALFCVCVLLLFVHTAFCRMESRFLTEAALCRAAVQPAPLGEVEVQWYTATRSSGVLQHRACRCQLGLLKQLQPSFPLCGNPKSAWALLSRYRLHEKGTGKMWRLVFIVFTDYFVLHVSWRFSHNLSFIFFNIFYLKLRNNSNYYHFFSTGGEAEALIP